MQTTKPSKKLLSTIMVTLLAMAIFMSVIPIASAIGALTLKDTADPFTKGPVGEKVFVNGTAATPWGLIKIYWNTPALANLRNETYAKYDGKFECYITVPEDYAGNHWVIAKDTETGAVIGGAEYEVAPKISLTPSKGIEGDTITVKGTGFSAESEVTISGTGITITTTVPATVTTTALGSFTCTFKIPTGTLDGLKTIKAEDEDYNSATAKLTVGPYITLTPEKGLMATTVTVKGRGFTADETVDIRWYSNATFYITLKDDYTIDSTGAFTTTFTVPLVPDPTPPGITYTVMAYESEEIKPISTFTVVLSAEISLVPKYGEADESVAVTGSWFTKSEKVTLTFGTTTLTTDPTTVTANSIGGFTCIFNVPDVAAGTYTVKATDAKAVSATATFKVIVPLIEIRTRATEYLRGDTISIYGNCTTAPEEAVLVITDPNGVLFWIGQIYEEDWVEMNGWDVLPYLYGFDGGLPLSFWPLPSDAPLGSWNFTAYETFIWEEQAGEDILDTNLFTVVASPSIQMVLDRLDELNANITDLVTTSEGKVLALITTAKGDILVSLDALNAKIVTISGTVATIATDVGIVKVDVAAIKLVVTAINGDVATIKTDVGTIKGQVLSIVGDVATIKTDVGTVKADVSTLKTSVTTTKTAADAAKTAADAAKAAVDGITTSITLAIIFSLVAALAAVFSVIQISRKIAG